MLMIDKRYRQLVRRPLKIVSTMRFREVSIQTRTLTLFLSRNFLFMKTIFFFKDWSVSYANTIRRLALGWLGALPLVNYQQIETKSPPSS